MAVYLLQGCLDLCPLHRVEILSFEPFKAFADEVFEPNSVSIRVFSLDFKRKADRYDLTRIPRFRNTIIVQSQVHLLFPVSPLDKRESPI